MKRIKEILIDIAVISLIPAALFFLTSVCYTVYYGSDTGMVATILSMFYMMFVYSVVTKENQNETN